MATLNTYVHVHRPEGSVVFGPGDNVPDWAVEQITREDVWDDGEPATDDAIEEPPRSGRGSGEDAWRTFAKASDVDVPADASRDDIIEQLEAAGVIDPADD